MTMPPVKARRFELHRFEDISGVSGTGIVADGVQFPDGVVAMRWRSDFPTSVVYAAVEASVSRS